MDQVRRLTVSLHQEGRPALALELTGADLAEDKAIVALEIRRDGGWRLAATAAGFDGGLAALSSRYGAGGAPPKAAPAKPPLRRVLKEGAPALAPLAEPVMAALGQEGLSDLTARVGLVLDLAGSMFPRYRDGLVQEIVNKVMPLAVQLSGDGRMDLWYYGATPRRRDPVTLAGYKQAVPSDWQGLMHCVGPGHDEPAVMREVMEEYGAAKSPALVIFTTDGAIERSDEIQALLGQATELPIFWRFLGLDRRADYGILGRLAAWPGGLPPHADLLVPDDFRALDGAAAYERLLGGFPQWLAAARERGLCG
jgi:hypothetical protein